MTVCRSDSDTGWPLPLRSAAIRSTDGQSRKELDEHLGPRD